MKRTLVWYIDRVRGDDESQGPVYYADHDYVPEAVRLHARLAPNGSDLKVDIRADGTSIFTSNYAQLNKGGNIEEHAEDYPDAEPLIKEGAIISFHVVRTAGAEGITCSLEMTSPADDDEDESE